MRSWWRREARGLLAAVGLALAAATRAGAPDTPAELAKELQNPIARLGNLVLENRVDLASGRPVRYTLNVIPIIPLEASRDWTFVSRTVLPVLWAQCVSVAGGDRFGLGDATTTLYLAGIARDTLLGVGPALRVPTATEVELGRGKWGAGPAVAVYRRDGPFTWGGMANHVWSFAGRDGSAVSTTLLQPSVAYTTPGLTTVGLATETYHDWTAGQWFVPLDANVSQFLRVLGRPVSIGIGGRLVLVGPPGAAPWSLRCTISLPSSR